MFMNAGREPFEKGSVRKLNRRTASLALALLVSLVSSTSLHPPLAALGSGISHPTCENFIWENIRGIDRVVLTCIGEEDYTVIGQLLHHR
jgi:hypothetical protein